MFAPAPAAPLMSPLARPPAPTDATLTFSFGELLWAQASRLASRSSPSFQAVCQAIQRSESSAT